MREYACNILLRVGRTLLPGPTVRRAKASRTCAGVQIVAIWCARQYCAVML